MSRVVITALIIRHDREDLFFRTTVQLNRVQLDITYFVSLEPDLADFWLVWDFDLFIGCLIVVTGARASRPITELHRHVEHVII